MGFEFSGYPPLLPNLMDKVLSDFSHGVDVSDTSRYTRAVENLKQKLGTFSEMPMKYAVSDRNLLLTPGLRSREEQEAAVEKLTAKHVAGSVNKILLTKSMKATALTMGNIPQENASAMFQKVNGLIKAWPGARAKPAAGEEVRHVVPVVKPAKPVEVRRMNQRPGDPNDVVVVSFLIGVKTIENQITSRLLSAVLDNIGYAELRTNRQLGYVVHAGISPLSNVHYVSVVVQGAKQNADEMEGAVEYVFAELMPNALKSMTDDEFTKQKASLREGILKPPRTFVEEFSYFWTQLSQGGNCTDVADEMLQHLDSPDVTKESLAQAWQEMYNPSEGMRTKVVVKHFAHAVPQRPTKDQAKHIWKKQKVPRSAFAQLEREYDEAFVFDKARTAERKEIMEKGGTYYPTTLNCKRAAVSTETVYSILADQNASQVVVSDSREKLRPGRRMGQEGTFLATGPA
jgi:secreted Zn-dependent insulinase-like peptidase